MKEVIQAVQFYMECGSVSGVARTFRRRANTCEKWIGRIAEQCARVNEAILRNLEVLCAQLDELWSYAQNKKNEQWVWNAIDAMTKLLIGFFVGPWTKKSAKRLVNLLRKRIKAVWLFLSDGLEHYIKHIARKFRGATYIQLVKHYTGRKLASTEIRHIQGFPVAVAEELLRLHNIGTHINTAFVERHNLTQRQSSSKLRRKTLCYAKLAQRLNSYMHIFQAYYNLVRPHMSLKENGARRTPAMAARLTNHVWTWKELLLFRC